MLWFGIPLLLLVVGLGALVGKSNHDQAEAVRRARAIPMTERQEILRACVKYARGIKPEQFERVFGQYQWNLPIPPEFQKLAPMRVNIYPEKANIKLQQFYDSGAGISCSNLDKPNASATLHWGEMGGQEPWAALESAE
ncbi:hypothetical protein [Luteolibacter sp. Populi]|uniref:hypothetical protein n=1 Tax=Luteolibacter sp. Populi TaxID=3230487 RepID=UPI0034650E99